MQNFEGADGRSSTGSAKRLTRLSAFVIVLMLMASACGGSEEAGDGSETATTTAPATTAQDGVATTAPATPAAPATTEATGEEATSDVSTATVTIADETYRFRDTGFITETCDTNFFGGAQVILLMVDENDEPVLVDTKTSSLSIVLIPEDVDDTPATVNLGTMDADREWIADPESLVVEGTQVVSWSIEGNRIEGTATFASTAGEEPTQGTFEVNCADE